MGNATLSNFEKVSVGGNNSAYLADLTMSSSYATGGDSFVTGTLPFSNINSICPFGLDSTGNYQYYFDQSTAKILAYTAMASGITAHTHELEALSRISSGSEIRIYVTSVTGTPAATNVVTGGTSSETATVAAYNASGGYIVVTSPSGAFTDGEALSFSVSGATATMRGNLVDSWIFAPGLTENESITALSTNAGVGLIRAATVIAAALTTDQYRLNGDSVETLHSDAITSVVIEGSSSTTSAAALSGETINEVANGTNLSAIVARVLVLGSN